ncbi:phage shock protein C (PspC) family protein [Salsuginibacillus halophilus]|uniref:Phage shock protein C (PspC) family protein n=1 Tax=Salsuginibacillus halophilus TaxID=517424 RepID=A0A2P8H984_9BACI|nr:PspC domain-containing protein [Salsuginibacillus halophilus]PSL42751.1 phage shock protein C (PspC) family protein [Salsuginibacillus halophilus]
MSSKRLTRTESDRKLAGVCGGLARYFGIDPTIVRVIAVLALVLIASAPVVILTYIILAIIMPNESDVEV